MTPTEQKIVNTVEADAAKAANAAKAEAKVLAVHNAVPIAIGIGVLVIVACIAAMIWL